MNGASVGVQAPQHPAQAELDRRRALGIRPGEAARLEVDVEEDQPGLDARHVEGGHADGHDAATAAGGPHGVPEDHGILAPDPDLVAQVAGVTGPRDAHRDLADLGLHVAEVGQLGDATGDRRQEVTRTRTLDRQHGPVVGDVLDGDVEAADEPFEVRKVRFRGREQVLVASVAQDDAILDDVAAVVAPGGVLRVARLACPDVAHEDTGQEPLGVGSGDAVLVERRRVEEAGAVADGEVLELVRHLVARGGQVIRPVLIESGLVERGEALVEGRRSDHARASRAAASASAKISTTRSTVSPAACDSDRNQGSRESGSGIAPRRIICQATSS